MGPHATPDALAKKALSTSHETVERADHRGPGRRGLGLDEALDGVWCLRTITQSPLGLDTFARNARVARRLVR